MMTGSEGGAGPTESVWDYPRPPRLEATNRHLEVRFHGRLVAETRSGHRVLETSHPPVYYFPPTDVELELLRPLERTTFCEWKGIAAYASIEVGGRVAAGAAWTYRRPSSRFAPIAGHWAFYAHLVDECRVDGEVVDAQAGGFYGGWITSDVRGPFKGGPGSGGW